MSGLLCTDQDNINNFYVIVSQFLLYNMLYFGNNDVCMLIVVHFWAPTFKWGISIANVADFSKPPEKLSYPQQIGMLFM